MVPSWSQDLTPWSRMVSDPVVSNKQPKGKPAKAVLTTQWMVNTTLTAWAVVLGLLRSSS
jgi:hypothetical protein